MTSPEYPKNKLHWISILGDNFFCAKSSEKSKPAVQTWFSKTLNFPDTPRLNSLLDRVSVFSKPLMFMASVVLCALMFVFASELFGVFLAFEILGFTAVASIVAFKFIQYKFPKMPKMPRSNAPKQKQSLADNESTLFLFVIGLLLSVFVLVGNFGAIGFLPFGMIVAGVVIQWKLNVKPKIYPSSGFSVKTLTYIAGGLILVLTINYVLGSTLSVAFLQPPISQAALVSSAQYANLPVYVYTLLFAISEEYLFRAVILYWILQYIPNQLVAVAGSSLLWMSFHLFVYGSQPLVLAFVFFTGLIFGFITLASNNILASTSIHGLNNLVATGLTVVKVVK